MMPPLTLGIPCMADIAASAPASGPWYTPNSRTQSRGPTGSASLSGRISVVGPTIMNMSSGGASRMIAATRSNPAAASARGTANAPT